MNSTFVLQISQVVGDNCYEPALHLYSSLLLLMQKGNPLLKHIRNVRWEFSDIVCDYLLGQNACALYLRFVLLDLSLCYSNYFMGISHFTILFEKGKESETPWGIACPSHPKKSSSSFKSTA